MPRRQIPGGRQVPALALAVLSGSLAGLSIRRAWPWRTTAIVLGLVSLPAFYPPFAFVGEFPGDTVPETNLTELVAALLGWTLYNAATVGLAPAIGTLGRKHGGDSPRSQMDPHS